VTSPSSVDTSKQAVESLAVLLARHAVGGNVLGTAAATLRTLQSQLEAATRDAERLRQLGGMDASVWLHESNIAWQRGLGIDSLRAALDAARAGDANGA